MYLDTILIKVSSVCNLNCSYCYVYNGEDLSFKEQPKVMSKETIEKILEALNLQSSKQSQGFAIVLHGGEPLMLGLEKMEYLLTSFRKVFIDDNKYPIAIQSNGLLINNEYINLFLKTKTTISISLDGMKNINDIARLDFKNRSSFQQVLNTITSLKKHENLLTGTLSVIHPNTSPEEIYNFFKSINIGSANFLLQDGNYNKLPAGKTSFETVEYGTWIKKLIEIYLSDESPTFEIPFIDDLIKVSLGGVSNKEGIGVNNYSILIIETNGEIRKNDTLRSSFNGADFLTNRPNIRNTKIDTILNSNEFIECCNLQTSVSQECLECKYVSICGGGMPLYRWSSDNKYNNPSIYCNDHKYYIKFIQEVLQNEI